VAYILALDEGTTSARAIVFDADGVAHAIAQREIRQIYPQPGWVEQDPREIWAAQSDVAVEALDPRRARLARRGRHRHHEPARDVDPLGPGQRRARGPRHRLAGPADRAGL
jgi:hypothetical protein